LEPGSDGQPAFASLADIKPGTTLEAALLKQDKGEPVAMALRPASAARAAAAGTTVQSGVSAAQVLFFPVTATFICFMLLLAEGISTRNWRRMIPRTLGGSLLGCAFSFVAYLPAGGVLMLSKVALQADAEKLQLVTASNMSAWPFIATMAGRSAAWACIAAAAGLGLTLIKGTRIQIRNAVLGGLIGGALGGLFFDPIDRFFRSSLFQDSSASRLVGLLAVGLSVGLFVALVERLAREAWILVRSGPLAGKAFVLYRTPTSIGSSPQADVYLYRDERLCPLHVLIHRVGQTFELHAQGNAPVTVGGEMTTSRRLQSGDQIIVGNTMLQFEERAKRPKSS
ncbi:MAG TPA: FHA domain-containing protein, partial [Polyangia bacterium]